MRDGAGQRGHLLGGEEGRAALRQCVREPLVVETVLGLRALGQLADQNAGLVPQILGLHPAHVLVGQRGQQEAPQRGDQPLERAHVVARQRDVGEQPIQRGDEESGAGAAQLRLERVEHLAVPSRRQRGVGAVHGPRELARQIVAVLDQQALDRGLGGGHGAHAPGPRQAGQTPAREAHDQLGGGGGLGRDLAALELREHEPHRRLALLVERLAHGGEGRRREARVLDVVEADHGDVGRHLQIALLQGGDRAQRHVVVRRREPIERHLALVDQQLDRGLARRFLERPLADQRRIELEAALLQHRAVDLVAVLGLGVDRRAADERDAPAAVADDQVLEGLAHARRLIDQQPGDAGRGDRDARHRERRQPLAQLGHGPRAEKVAERATQHDRPVQAALVTQIEHEVAVDAVAARGAQHAAREHHDVHVAPVGDLGDAGQQRGLVGLPERIDQHADARPLAAGPRLVRAWPRYAGGTALVAPAHFTIRITGTRSGGPSRGLCWRR